MSCQAPIRDIFDVKSTPPMSHAFTGSGCLHLLKVASRVVWEADNPGNTGFKFFLSAEVRGVCPMLLAALGLDCDFDFAANSIDTVWGQ